MATLKKKDLKKYKFKDSKKKEELDELVDADGSPIEGSRTTTNDTEIETGPPLDFGKKGVSQTSDEFANAAIQPNRDYYGVGGTAYSRGARVHAESVKDKMTKMVEDILSDKSDSAGMVKKGSNSDVNRNEIPDIQDLSDKYNKPIAAKKTQELLNTIMKNNLNGEEVGIVLNYLLGNLDTTKIPNDYRRVIKGKL